MSRNFFKTVVICVFALCFVFSATAKANLEEGMAQGDFTLWLVKAVGAMYKLPPGGTSQDAVAFLTSLGMVPEGDWQVNEKVTKEFLASLLDLSEEEKKALLQDPKGFDKLAEKVRDLLQKRFDDARQGVFRIQSASGSVPA